MTLTITRNNTPLTVWLEWMAMDGTVYGLIAYTRSGEAVVLSSDEYDEALELAYSEMPANVY